MISGLLFAAAFVASAHSQLLLTIDWSNRSAVTFTATSNGPAFSYGNGPEDTPVYPGGASSFQGEDGVTLANFLTSAYSTSGDVGPEASSSTLMDYSGDSLFDQLYVIDQSGSLIGLNIYAVNTSGHLVFANGEAAFSGSAVFDLSASQYDSFMALFPEVGATGSIVMYNTYDYALGTWQVTGAAAVPEPSTYAIVFGVVALIGTVIYRRRKVA